MFRAKDAKNAKQQTEKSIATAGQKISKIPLMFSRLRVSARHFAALARVIPNLRRSLAPDFRADEKTLGIELVCRSFSQPSAGKKALDSADDLRYLTAEPLTTMGYFRNSFIVTFVGLGLGALLGWEAERGFVGALSTVFIVGVLAILEVSLSFDNAVVNATVLKEMTPVWRHRFLTWGIAIAVFGMRIIFPLIIVAIIARIDPWSALVMAATDPDQYSRVLTSAHVTVAAFGGAFLAMVGLKHFFNKEKVIHWIAAIERPLTRLGRIEAVELGLVLLLLYGVSRWLQGSEQIEFLVAGIFGLVTYIAVDGVSALLNFDSAITGEVAQSGVASFLYLEVLDASFSFDGVIGAFALSNNLFVIAIGLGIGAMFVRSLTIMLVEKETLASYRYLEHGAFYAIIALAVMMFLNAVIHIPEVVTGLIGSGFIIWAFFDSIRYNRRERGA